MGDFIHFGLIVTGNCEERHLPKLFKSIEKAGLCHFEVIRCIGQTSPVSSKKKIKELKIVGSQKMIPDKDAENIGFPARRYINKGSHYYVILVDDLEYSRKSFADKVFERYRNALDTILRKEKYRASVHFLVNMIEAYYFADAKAVNIALKVNPLFQDCISDVEEIRNPKGELRKIYSSYNEIEDGGRILELIDIDKVLSNGFTCAWLRSLFAWCIYVLNRNPYYDIPVPSPYCIDNGIYSFLTGKQISFLSESL